MNTEREVPLDRSPISQRSFHGEVDMAYQKLVGVAFIPARSDVGGWGGLHWWTSHSGVLFQGKMSSIFGPHYYARGFDIGIVAPGFYFLDYFLFFIFSVYFEVCPSSFLLSVFFPLNFKCPFVCHILFGKSYQVILSSKQFKHKLPKNFSKTAFYYGL